ncbi:MAG TPA: molybdopterin converting factor subunit 1 [Bacteroidota bacterium]|nr:molybdopterin converting factor subunit 1 [Bacteroidota bacterium]
MHSDTIVVTVRFFASARDVAKRSEMKLELPPASVAADVLERITSQFPAMKDLRTFTRIAVNESYVGSDFALSDGDEIAVIPPVSGG